MVAHHHQNKKNKILFQKQKMHFWMAIGKKLVYPGLANAAAGRAFWGEGWYTRPSKKRCIFFF